MICAVRRAAAKVKVLLIIKQNIFKVSHASVQYNGYCTGA